MSEKTETTIRTSPAGIARSNRMFIALKSIGECDDKGKMVFSRGYDGKRIMAQPDRPINTLILPLLIALVEMAHWESDESMAADLEVLKRYVAGLQIKPKQQPPA